MFYNARWYDSQLGRFTQADSIVPGGVQGYDRYAYVNNNPVNGTDPSGHCPVCIVAFVALNADAITAVLIAAFIGGTAASGAYHSYQAGDTNGTLQNLAMLPVAGVLGSSSASQMNSLALPAEEESESFLLRGAGWDRETKENIPTTDSRARMLTNWDKQGDPDTVGVSVFKSPPVNPSDMFNNPILNRFLDKAVKIDEPAFPPNLSIVLSPGTLKAPLLDNNHYVIRDSARYNSMPWEEYMPWWNEEMAPLLATLAKQFTTYNKE